MEQCPPDGACARGRTEGCRARAWLARFPAPAIGPGCRAGNLAAADTGRFELLASFGPMSRIRESSFPGGMVIEGWRIT